MSSLKKMPVPLWPAAMLAAGILGVVFWRTSAVGAAATDRYESVSAGTTGHAESVKIVFDPAEISYGQLLQIAFSVVHDPDYHQHYLVQNPSLPYIALIDMPKIENFRRTYPELYSGRPVLARNEGGH